MPRIGLEPTCREALAPETSVSTISPSGHRFDVQRYYSFFISQQIYQKYQSPSGLTSSLSREISLILERPPLEQQQISRRNADVRISEVENRTKEVVVVINQETQPARHTIPLKQREIEHIHHLTHQK